MQNDNNIRLCNYMVLDSPLDCVSVCAVVNTSLIEISAQQIQWIASLCPVAGCAFCIVCIYIYFPSNFVVTLAGWSVASMVEWLVSTRATTTIWYVYGVILLSKRWIECVVGIWYMPVSGVPTAHRHWLIAISFRINNVATILTFGLAAQRFYFSFFFSSVYVFFFL